MVGRSRPFHSALTSSAQFMTERPACTAVPLAWQCSCWRRSSRSCLDQRASYWCGTLHASPVCYLTRLPHTSSGREAWPTRRLPCCCPSSAHTSEWPCRSCSGAPAPASARTAPIPLPAAPYCEVAVRQAQVHQSARTRRQNVCCARRAAPGPQQRRRPRCQSLPVPSQ